MSSAPLTTSLTGSHGPGGAHYTLSSELAQFCLPTASRDVNRRFAYANSLCFAFLVIGLIGVRSPNLLQKALPDFVELIPVVFVPPPEEQQVKPETPPDEPDTPQDTTADTPVVATVVAADTSAVTFAVPVEGPVLLAPAKYAPPPPAVLKPRPSAPPQPTRFLPTNHPTDGGHYPPPPYPRLALERRLQGSVLALVTVDAAGGIASAEVKDSSGVGLLDRCVIEWIKKQWRFPPVEGRERQYLVPMEFNIK